MNTFQWSPIDAEGNLLTAKYQAQYAISRSTLIKLSDRQFVIFSPGIPLLKSVTAHLPEDSSLIILAPNVAHISGIKAWLEKYPKATVVASKLTREKIKKVFPELQVVGLDKLKEKLPEQMELHEVPNCNFGEVWLNIKLDEAIFWCVCDGFTNLQQYSNKTIKRWLQKLYGLKLGLWVTRAFRQNITNNMAFKKWAQEKFTNNEKNLLIPCHGDIYTDPEFSDQAKRLLDRRF